MTFSLDAAFFSALAFVVCGFLARHHIKRETKNLLQSYRKNVEEQLQEAEQILKESKECLEKAMKDHSYQEERCQEILALAYEESQNIARYYLEQCHSFQKAKDFLWQQQVRSIQRKWQVTIFSEGIYLLEERLRIHFQKLDCEKSSQFLTKKILGQSLRL